jgi:hypothetical protein
VKAHNNKQANETKLNNLIGFIYCCRSPPFSSTRNFFFFFCGFSSFLETRKLHK